MSERDLPTRDIKNSLKFTSKVSGAVFENLKPAIQRSASRSFEKVLQRIASGNKIKFK